MNDSCPQAETNIQLGKVIDDFATLDLTGLGLVGRFHRALCQQQPLPLYLKAAELIKNALPAEGGLAFLATGFPMGGGVPETDGPVGSALLARLLWRGFNTRTVILVEEGWEFAVRAACIGAGLSPINLNGGQPARPAYLQEVYIQTLPRGAEESRRLADDLLAQNRPHLLLAVERPGGNQAGVCHGHNGRTLGALADVDYLFARGQGLGIPFVAIGDGGNELGMGCIKDEIRACLPQATDCGCPCGGGTAAHLKADALLAASVSNWGASCLCAALAVALGDLSVLHQPEDEVRCLTLCADSGAVDGGSLAPVPNSDGVPAKVWEGLFRALATALAKGMNQAADWRTKTGNAK